MKLFIGKEHNAFKEFLENPWTRRALRAYAAVFPLVLFFALEWLNPVSSGFLGVGVVLMSVLLIAAAAVPLFVLTGSPFWGFLPVSAILGTAYIVNHFKFAITGQVFVPSDVLLAGEALGVTNLGSLVIERTLILQVLLIILLHAPLFFVKFKPNLKKRLIILGGAATAFLLLFVFAAPSQFVMERIGVPYAFRGARTLLYRDSGLIMGFHTTMMQNREHSRRMPGLVAYAEEFFGSAPSMTADNIQPNVIIIMSESFVDPNIFTNLEMSVNPVSNLHRLSAQAISGDTIVPVFGGGTVNTELEFLAGTPIYLLGGSAYSIPYASPWRYFNRNIYTAMPWLFQKNGYRTVAVHPNYADFYNRDRVFPRLGFQEFIAKEDMPDAPIKGWYISDEYFTDRVIEQIVLAEEANEPLFLFGISMQNHWEFWEYKYYGFDQDITSSSPYLSEIELARMDSLLQGIYDADKELGRLVDFIESRDTPTVVVFFGDHMPIIGAHDDAILANLGFISARHSWEWTIEDRRKIFTTPYLVWSNFADNNQEWGTLSTYFLAARVLEFSGIPLNRYWEKVLHMGEYFRALTENHYVSIDGNFYDIYNVWLLRPDSAAQYHVWGLEHVNAFAGLTYTKWFGDGDFHRSLSIGSLY
ncbi:MAG: LTA synthase family protein [Clostridiales bacterium]|jgi:phosphoglycerol transferase MdoB-like AlkP superfamily enzyme|nr:LTA synthase family protein [Clostridiales bacterium]